MFYRMMMWKPILFNGTGIMEHLTIRTSKNYSHGMTILNSGNYTLKSHGMTILSGGRNSGGGGEHWLSFVTD